MSSNKYTTPTSGTYTVSASCNVTLSDLDPMTGVAFDIDRHIQAHIDEVGYFEQSILESMSTEKLTAELLRRTSLGKELE